MRKAIFASLLLLLPAAALAQTGNCEHSRSQDLQLDLTGVKAVVFSIGPHDIDVQAAPGSKAVVRGKACASDMSYLNHLALTQRRVGEKLVVRAERSDRLLNFRHMLGSHYARWNLQATVPDNIMVQMNVGSGDATVAGVSALSADVGSGDLHARRIRGLVTADVGSGDIQLEDIGELHVIDIGSGDLSARTVAHGVRIGDIGSGDATLRDVGGSVIVDSIGSGGVQVRNVRGDLIARSVGSGSVDHSGVSGKIDVDED